MARQEIFYRQRRWAVAHGIKFVEGCSQTVEENLFQPLTATTQADYASGRGDGLGGATDFFNMRMFYSSSALICNVFDYWCSQLLLGQPLTVLSTALGAPAPVKQMRFEQSYRTGLGDTPPYLDVVLQADGSKPFLIESQFTEPYNPHSPEDAPTKSYYPNSGELWGKYGLTRCEALARRIHGNEEQFFQLNVPQLLNRILGILNIFQKDFTLLYLWYDHYSSEATDHRAEVNTIIHRLNGEIDFRTMTYQELFQKMQGDPTADEKYIAYLKERYFQG